MPENFDNVKAGEGFIEDKFRKLEERVANIEDRPMTTGAISEISSDLGDMVAGRFISPIGEDAEPTSATFSGAFQSGSGEDFPEGNVKFGAVTDGVLNFGVLEDGTVIANNIDFNGATVGARLEADDFGWMTRQTGTEGSEVRTMRMGMESDGTNGEGKIEFFEPSTPITIPNGDFASLDFTDWDEADTGVNSWDATNGYAEIDLSAGETGTLENSARFAVTAGQVYNFSLLYKRVRGTTSGSVSIKFYTAITGGSLVSTESVFVSNAITAWALKEKNITVPATATHAIFYASVSGSGVFSFDDFSATQIAIDSELIFRDDGLYYSNAGAEVQLGGGSSLEVLYAKAISTSIAAGTETTVFSRVLASPYLDTHSIRWSVRSYVNAAAARNAVVKVKVNGSTIITLSDSVSVRPLWHHGTFAKNGTDTQHVHLTRIGATSSDSYSAATADDGADITFAVTYQITGGAVTSADFMSVIVEGVEDVA